ncbi:hypothetical protein G7059_07910 [Erysipelothrix sp. HDW6A]|uniref:phage tail tube protein n=1 Tax=Erysipelothrix sp. HDW6A TaxID=2714928 RepID=UPI00140B2B9C|nr:phage tail tube protein [Erysipelothrix sp. HDW6A]QIK57768.1 hypothetical protein G7059_07910 [Erysipelothrix sp. HDW6A]
MTTKNEINPINETEEENVSKEEKRTIGTKLTLAKISPETEDTKIGDLTSIGEIGLESEEIDITTHDSEGDFKEFIAGSKDAGEVSVEGYLFNHKTFETLLKLANSREVRDWTVTYPSGAEWSFKAFVKSIKDAEKGLDSVAGFSMSLRVSGAPTFTAAK